MANKNHFNSIFLEKVCSKTPFFFHLKIEMLVGPSLTSLATGPPISRLLVF